MKKNLVLMLVLLLSISFAACGAKDEALYKSGVELYKANDYPAAIEKFLAAIEVNENYTKAYYNLSTLYTKLDPPDYANAMMYIKKAIEKGEATGIDKKKLDSWKKKADSILVDYYEKVVKVADTIEGYQKFIDENPDYPGNNDIKVIIDTKKFEAYKSKDTIEAYEEFIKENPDNKFVYDAESKIYNKLIDKNEEDAYKKYLADHPDSKFKTEINGKLAEMEYDKVDKMDDGNDKTKALQDFIAKYPEMEITKVAKDKIVEVDWKTAVREGSEEAFGAFIKKHPESQFAEDAQKKIDTQQFRKAKDEASLVSSADEQMAIYNKFIKDYPDNKYIKKVQELVDRLKKQAKEDGDKPVAKEESKPAKEEESPAVKESSDSGSKDSAPAPETGGSDNGSTGDMFIP